MSFTQKTQKTVTLQATGKKISTELLNKSASIITSRLKTYGLEPVITADADKGQIIIQIPDDINIPEIKGLLTDNGNFGFYEMLTRKEIARPSEKITDNNPSDARLACSASENVQTYDSVANYLKSIDLPSDYRLVWGLRNSKDQHCLFAVKIRNTGSMPLGRRDIENITVSADSDRKSFIIGIKFRPAASKIWADETRNNLGKPVAIMVDDNVWFWPVVKSPIENGLCEITGDLTQTEADYFKALVNNDPLPAQFVLK